MSAVDTDVIIIGSGLGGLTSAILLGEMGHRAMIIERNSQPGGLLRSYTRQGVDCAVGLHYFGPAGEGELLRQIFDILGVTEKLRLRRLGSGGVLERYVFDELSFDLPSTLPGFEQALRSLCPDDAAAIETIVSATGALARGLHFDPTGRLQSSLFAYAGFDQSMEDFLAASGCSKKLHDILTVHGFWTGLPMDKCPAYLLLYTLGALLQSAWELGCTGSEMAEAFADRALATGAEMLLGDPVEHLLVRDGQACGVRLKSGRTVTCRKIIAGIHPKLVLAMLPDDAVAAGYRQGLMNLEETPGVVCVRLLVDRKQHEAPGYNLFRIHKVDGVNIDGTFLQLRESGLAGCNVLTIIHGSAYGDWKQWHHTRTGNRGAQYEQAKMRAAEPMIETARSVLGRIEDFRILDISTPLTMRDWVASPEGSLYGLLRSVKNELQYAVLTRLPVRSLYLVGQSAIAPGLLGVTLSVLRGVGEVAGRANFQNFLASRLAALA